MPKAATFVVIQNLNPRTRTPALTRARVFVAQEFRDTIKFNFGPEQKSQYLRIGRDSEFQDGVIELSWAEVESAFRSHVDVSAAKALVRLGAVLICPTAGHR